MISYILRRVLVSIPLFFIITMLVHGLYTLSPGDPVANIVGYEQMMQMTPEQIERVREQYGFNKPWIVRYGRWLGKAVRGDLGYPYKAPGTVLDNLRERIGPTLQLMATALVLSLIIGIPVGIVQAFKQYSWLDYGLTVGVFLNLSIPVFFVSLGMMYIFSLKLDLLPTSGMSTIGEPFSLVDRLEHLVMPAIVLSGYYAGMYARYTRASILEVMREDYVRVARAKGLRERAVVVVHVFRNALLPLITIVTLSLPRLVGGAVIVETIFQWPGLGMLGWRATTTRDYPLLMGILLLSTSAILVSNLVADVAYGIADPRVTYD